MSLKIAGNISNISFGVKPIDFYNEQYFIKRMGYNGTGPDQFVLDKLTQLFPEPNCTNVLDIGAGDGRNTIPIANQGYNITAYEPCVQGRKLIDTQAIDNGLESRIVNSDTNILSGNGVAINEFDFALMSHVSMHFNPSKLQRVLSNIYSALKPGGYLVFDALIQDPGASLRLGRRNESFGDYSFKQKELEKMINIANFHQTGQPIIYNEAGPSRSPYTDHYSWGGLIPERSGPYNAPRPVTLKWFVLQKKPV